MIEEAHQAMRGDPEREAKAWLEKIADTIEGLLSPDELRHKLTQLTEQRKTAARARSAAHPNGTSREPGA
jgi:truncated hemoglobin YjbI